MQKYHNIFSTTVKEKSARAPTLDFKVDAAWELTANRLTSRKLSPEIHLALHGMIEELLDLNVIEPSKATSLVRKPAPSNGWRFTIDYRGLNKVIINQGWHYPNVSCLRCYNVFETSDLSSSTSPILCTYFSNAHHRWEHAIYSIRYILRYLWMDPVPNGLLPSANYFQMMMAEYVLHGLIYIIMRSINWWSIDIWTDWGRIP